MMRTLWRSWSAACAETWANRAGFWLQVTIMMVNGAVWVVFWWLFFRRVGSLRGWSIDEMVLLLSVFATTAGVLLGLAANVKWLGRLAADGGLDAVLALPAPPLALVLSRRVEAVNMGDLMFGPLLFLLLGQPTPTRALIWVFGVAASVLVGGGFLLASGSLAFFASREQPGDLAFHALFVFSNYPADIFGGVARLLLYGVVPAAFVSTVPAQLVDDFQPVMAVALVVAATVSCAVGVTLFQLGLRRYTSAAAWIQP